MPKENGARVDAVLRLQDYAEGWQDGHFEEKWGRAALSERGQIPAVR